MKDVNRFPYIILDKLDNVVLYVFVEISSLNGGSEWKCQYINMIKMGMENYKQTCIS